MPPKTASAPAKADDVAAQLQKLAAALVEDSDPKITMPVEGAGRAIDTFDSMASEPGGPALPPILSLDDLIADDSGAVVLDMAVGQVVIVTDLPVIAEGLVEPATGADLAGMAYVSFSDGPTLYFPTDLKLEILPSA